MVLKVLLFWHILISNNLFVFRSFWWLAVLEIAHKSVDGAGDSDGLEQILVTSLALHDSLVQNPMSFSLYQHGIRIQIPAFLE